MNKVEDIAALADKVVSDAGSRDAFAIASALGIEVLDRPFRHQKGVYKVVLGERFVFLKEDLDPVMKNIVLLHEIGHDMLHRKESVAAGAFREFNIFSHLFFFLLI